MLQKVALADPAPPPPPSGLVTFSPALVLLSGLGLPLRTAPAEPGWPVATQERRVTGG